MVKNLLSIFLSFLLLAGISVYEVFYVEKKMSDFTAELKSFYLKIEEKNAVKADGLAVKKSWDETKKTLHVWVPHNDISYIDYWLNESISLVYTENYDDALSKIEVLISISENIPSAYSFSLENVF